MRAIDDLLAEITLVRFALAIAVGWSLYQVAHGFATLVDGVTANLPPGPGSQAILGSPYPGFGLTWIVDHHILHFDDLVIGLIELAVVLSVGALLLRLQRQRSVAAPGHASTRA